MSRSRRQLAEDKALLLARIQQQRLELAQEKRRWLTTANHYDRYWRQLVGLRRYLLLGSGVLAVLGVRHRGRLLVWGRRAVKVWGVVNVFRSAFSPR